MTPQAHRLPPCGPSRCATCAPRLTLRDALGGLGIVLLFVACVLVWGAS